MSEPDFNHFDGDWDEFHEEPAWSESQWRDYLDGSERDTARFLSVYNSLSEKHDPLDEAAALMGWDAEDISLTRDLEELPAEDGREREDPSESPPYTLHRHPVFIVTRALYRYLRQSWEHFMARASDELSAEACWKYADSLHRGEMNAVLAIQALDMGDFGLAVCHLKNGLSALNDSLAQLDALTHPNARFLNAFRREIRIRVFDLREVWLRVMRDCRAEQSRRSGER